MEFWTRLFGENEIKPVVTRQWRKWEYRELIGDLYKAEEILSEMNIDSSKQHLRVVNFHKRLLVAIDKLEDSDHSYFSFLKAWFAPNSVWFSLTGNKTVSLGSKIYDRVYRLSEMKKENSTTN